MLLLVVLMRKLVGRNFGYGSNSLNTTGNLRPFASSFPVSTSADAPPREVP